MNPATLIGLSGISLLLSTILFTLLTRFNVRKPIAYGLSALVFMLSFIPIAGYTVNEYLRGLFNDLSFTSIMLLGYYLLKPDDGKRQIRPLLWLLALTGIFFYPAALGLGPVDPYAWGYLNKTHGLVVPLLFLAVMAALMTLAYIRQCTVILACLVCSSVAFQLDLLESRNFWDYFIDPLLWLYALITILSQPLALKWAAVRK